MKTILFLIGTIVFNCRDAYAIGSYYTSGFGLPVYSDKYFNVVMSIAAVTLVILTVMVFKAFKEGETNKDPNEGIEADESVKNFLKDEQEKPRKEN